MVDRKGSRRTQAERAEATRSRLLATAREMFIRDGYASTTMARIAEAAGYAVQTVYLVFRTKGNLLLQVYEAAVVGDDDPVPPDQAPWFRAALTTSDGPEAITIFVEGSAQILRRTGPLESAVQNAEQTEPRVKRIHEQGERLRVIGYRRFVESLSDRGLLTDAADLNESADVLLTLLGPSTYATFTDDRGWTHSHYTDWATRALSRLLL